MLNLRLYLGDAFDILKDKQEKWKHKFRMGFFDPPYFVSSGKGILERPEGSFKRKGVRLHKGDWDADISDWKDIYKWNYRWLKLVKPLIAEDGTIFVCGMWNINLWTVRMAMEELGYSHLNNIVIIKPNAVPNLKGVRFAASHENMIWAKPNKDRYFAYWRMKKYSAPDSPSGKQMKDYWIIPVHSRTSVGEHPTQKTFEQVRRCILSTTDENDWVLDPFSGTCTTMKLCKELNRNCVCIEKGFYYADAITNKYKCNCGKEFKDKIALINHHNQSRHKRQFLYDIEKKVGWGDSSLDQFVDKGKLTVDIAQKQRDISYKKITKYFKD